MEKNEALVALQSLLTIVQNYDAAIEEKTKALNELKRAESRTPKALIEFDKKHKQSYIVSQIGEAPVKPKGIIKLAVPAYLKKKKEYEKANAIYQSKYQEREAVYFKEYAEQRSKIENDERVAIEEGIQNARKKFDELSFKEVLLKREYDLDSTLGEELKNEKAIHTLIGYFQNHRVDTMKEAVNLYYEEEHRKRLEALAKKQVSLTKEAAEQAQRAAKSAEDAADIAQMAMNRADEAYEKAEAAYNEAFNRF